MTTALLVTTSRGGPLTMHDGGETVEIESIQDRWAIEDEWWREPIRIGVIIIAALMLYGIWWLATSTHRLPAPTNQDNKKRETKPGKRKLTSVIDDVTLVGCCCGPFDRALAALERREIKWSLLSPTGLNCRSAAPRCSEQSRRTCAKSCWIARNPPDSSGYFG